MRTNMKIYVALIATLAAGAFFVACNKDTNMSTPSATTPYNMYMTDAPGAYQQVNVNIIGAMVHSDIGGWVTLSIHPGIYDLLTLSNGKDTLIANGQVTVGRVSQIRLILGATGNTVKVNGNLYTLLTPSDQQSGLKLNVDNTLTAGVTYNLTIDFDAGASVVQNADGSYTLKPVIRAVVAPTSGALKGIIAPSSASTEITASSSVSGEATAFSSSASGDFLVQGLASGSYQVTVTPLPPFAVQTFTNVMVSTGQVTDMGTIMLH
jgi:hypothetical protein